MSASSSNDNIEKVRCTCGNYMAEMISNSMNNPGRKYWKCNCKKGQNGCGRFIWHDELYRFSGIKIERRGDVTFCTSVTTGIDRDEGTSWGDAELVRQVTRVAEELGQLRHELTQLRHAINERGCCIIL